MSGGAQSDEPESSRGEPNSSRGEPNSSLGEPDSSLGEPECPHNPQAAAPDALVRDIRIVNQKGLHARASAKFVQTVEKFDSEVLVSRCGETVGGTSIMGLMMLAAGIGTSIRIQASGREAAEAMAALESLICGKFGESE